MKTTLLLFLLSVLRCFADFSDDQFPERADILPRIITAAKERGYPLAAKRRAHDAYYLRSAEYVGALQAPFGTVHVARLNFTWAQKNRREGGLPMNLAFLVFLDRDLDIRVRWNIPVTLGRLSTNGTKLMLDDRALFDYAHFNSNDPIRIETGVQFIPRWK